MSEQTPQRAPGTPGFQERRKKSDWVTNMAAILSLVSWVVVFAVWALLDRAAPEQAFIFTNVFGLQVRDYWDSTLIPIAFALLIASVLTCVAAFIFNKLRKRRRTDKYRKSIIIIGAVNIAALIFFIIRFDIFSMW